jgi:hypothetical protein
MLWLLQVAVYFFGLLKDAAEVKSLAFDVGSTITM